MEDNFLNPNPVEVCLGKKAKDFTKKDIIRFVKENNVKIINFNYVAGDGRMKTLSFVINGEQHLNELLERGERVDGSSLFPYIDTESSDLYVIPKFSTIFLDPFNSISTLHLMCSFFNKEGNPLEIAPENIVKKAHEKLKKNTGLSMKALTELEYYVIFNEEDNELYPGSSQKNYHESAPFVKYEEMRNEIISILSSTGAKIKYAHAEVGDISEDGNKRMEQHEIEFLLESIEDMAYHTTIAKWVVRKVGEKHGVNITFTPKLEVGHAGSGMHVHMALFDENNNNVLQGDNGLEEIGKKAIGGLIKHASSLTAFGNAVPVSYLRLVPNQEAPTNICWGDRNRSVLIRVPLNWGLAKDMSSKVNLNAGKDEVLHENRATIELRSPDASANPYLLLAGMALAVERGLNSDDSLELAEKNYVQVNIFKEENKSRKDELDCLPTSCFESADELEKDRALYEGDNVFPETTISGTIKQLKKHDDKDLAKKALDNKKELDAVIKIHMHCG